MTEKAPAANPPSPLEPLPKRRSEWGGWMHLCAPLLATNAWTHHLKIPLPFSTLRTAVESSVVGLPYAMDIEVKNIYNRTAWILWCDNLNTDNLGSIIIRRISGSLTALSMTEPTRRYPPPQRVDENEQNLTERVILQQRTLETFFYRLALVEGLWIDIPPQQVDKYDVIRRYYRRHGRNKRITMAHVAKEYNLSHSYVRRLKSEYDKIQAAQRSVRTKKRYYAEKKRRQTAKNEDTEQ